jgi:hypothetical protein
MFTGATPVRQESWDWGPDNTEKKKKLEGVLSQVDSLIAEGLTGELSLETFFTWRNRPLRACAHGIWLYAGPSDLTRESAEELTKSEVEAQVKRVLGEGTLVNLGNSPTLLHQGVPSTRIRVSATF